MRVIFNDEEAFENEKALQVKAIESYKLAQKEVSKIDIEIDNVKDFLDSPVSYLEEKYYNTHFDRIPPGIGKDKALKLTSLNFQYLDQLTNEVKNAKNVVVTKDDVILNVKKTDYDFILDPAKEKEYDLVSAYFNLFKELEKNQLASGGLHLIRTMTGSQLQMSNSGVVINNYYFKLN